MSTKTPTNSLPPKYVPNDHEPAVRERWESSDAFHADPEKVLSGEREPYCILIPPPNVTAALHLGHALNNTLQDVLIRYHRMKGYETLWMPGTDHAGIATQTVVEKRVLAEEGKKRTDFERDDFIAKVQAFKDEYEAHITRQFKAMGCSCDWERQRFTMDEICARAVREAFFRLFKDGLIYRGKRLVNWDPITQTALADDEVENEEVEGIFAYLRYPLVHETEPGNHSPVTWSELGARGYPGADKHPDDDQAYVTVATTRPETYLGDTAVAVNPDDPRAGALRGLRAELPLVGRVIPIVEDSYVVLPVALGGDENDAKAKMATGFLKVTPAHDPNDWEIGQRHDLPVINVMAPDASISENHGWDDYDPHHGSHVFIGLSREDARQKVLDEFKARGLLEAVKPHVHSVGHSYRSHAAIEPYLSDQWYVKVTDDRLRGSALRAMSKEQRTGSPVLRTGSSQIHTESTKSTASSLSPVHANISLESTSHIQPEGFIPRDPYPPGEPSPTDLIQSIRALPHLTLPGATYFVTWNVAEGTLSADEAKIVKDALTHHHGTSVQLYAAVVMPDHVHVIVRPLNGMALKDWVASVKRFSATSINKRRERSGHFWQADHFDHIVRDGRWFAAFVGYIIQNPVNAGLTDSAEKYPHTLVDSSVLREIAGQGDSESERPSSENWATKKAHDGNLTFHPPRYAKTFEQWHENLRDWCISRQLWWGHRIPVWSGTLSGMGGISKDSQVWKFPMKISEEIGDPDRIFHEIQPQPQGEDGMLTFHICVAPGHEEAEQILHEKGFFRDPDVLDTWFSSALWPMSTMGWPDPEAAGTEFAGLLEAFNPSSVLCTAREIITLWVSRMVMFNRYLLSSDSGRTGFQPVSDAPSVDGQDARPTNDGQLPFHDVFIHAMIQDGEGRKMSKSLGNGVDPLDIIESHGTDALRYTLCEMTTQTQDVRMPVETDPETGKNTSPKFDKGRNFCTKLYNAAKFVTMMLSEKAGGEPDSVTTNELDVIDRWMLSRLARAAKQIDECVGQYEFSNYAQELFSVLRSDYCDWYLEGVKPTLATKPAQRIVLQQALEAILRLLHPVTPFITEVLAPSVHDLRTGSVEGLTLPDGRDPSMLCTSGWPEISEALIDNDAETRFERMQTLVDAIRRVRAQHKVPPRRQITLHADAGMVASLGGVGQVTETLAGLDAITTMGPEGEAVSFDFEGIELRLSNLADAVDADTERERLGQDLKALEGSISALEKRLGNPGYTDKAPAHLVDETRKKLEQQQAERDAITKRLEELA